MQMLKDTLKSTDFGLLFTAFIAINLSKVLSVARISLFYRAIEVELKNIEALCLYYLGMFYNTLLPGGIGGDGYKIYYLHKNTRVKLGTLTSATILDRLSGVVAIFFLLSVIAIFAFIEGERLLIELAFCIASLLLLGLVWKAFLGKFFASYRKIGFSSVYWAIWVQIFEVVTILFIALSLGIDGHYQLIATLFFLSSILSVLPISIGGLGIRELVFMKGFLYLGLTQESGIAIGFLFFLLTLLSSALGGFCLARAKPLGTESRE